MGDNSKIEWTDASWNPLVGCEKVGPGCDNCYAIPTVHRGEAMGTVQHAGLTIRTPSGALDWNGQINYVPERIGLVAKWRRPRRIFVNSLSDPFHRDVPDEFLLDLWRAMAAAPQHQFQLLTKRPQRMAEFTNRLCWDEDDEDGWVPYLAGDSEEPLPNVALLTSIENNTYAWRAEHVRASNAAIRGVSAEPLLGPLDKLDLTGLDWLIVGGESGQGARPMHPQWVRELRDRCTERPDLIRCDTCDDDAELESPDADPDDPDYWAYQCMAGHESGRPGPAFHFKQYGNWAELEAMDWRGTHVVELDGTCHPRLGESPAAIAERGAVIVANYGKHEQGNKGPIRRTLDGRTWDEYPAADVLASA